MILVFFFLGLLFAAMTFCYDFKNEWQINKKNKNLRCSGDEDIIDTSADLVMRLIFKKKEINNILITSCILIPTAWFDIKASKVRIRH